MQTGQSELLRVREAAERLGVHANTIRRHVHDGHLQAVRLGPTGTLRIRAEALDAFLEPATGKGSRAGHVV